MKSRAETLLEQVTGTPKSRGRSLLERVKSDDPNELFFAPTIPDPQGLPSEGLEPFVAPLTGPETTTGKQLFEFPKSLAAGAERHILGFLPKTLQWGAERATIGELATKHLHIPGSKHVAEYLVRKYGPNKPVEFFDTMMKRYADEAERMADFWDEQASKGWEAPDEEIMQAKWRDMPLGKTMQVGGQAIPSYGMAIGASLATKSPNVGLMMLSLSSGGEMFRRQRKAGTPVHFADALAHAQAAWEYTTEKIPFEYIFKPGVPLLKRFVIQPSMEAVQELAQGFGENMLEHFGYNAKDWESVPAAVKESISHTFDGWLENFVGGLFPGMLGAGAGAMFAPPKPKAPTMSPAQQGVVDRFNRDVEDIQEQYGVGREAREKLIQRKKEADQEYEAAEAKDMAMFELEVERETKPVIKKPAAKQPWEMTATELVELKEKGDLTEKFGIEPWQIKKSTAVEAQKLLGGKEKTAEIGHDRIIRKAVREGKPVPAEVLAEYPDLKPAAEGEVKGVVPEGEKVEFRENAEGKKLYVDWGKKRVVKKGLGKGTYYATYFEDGQFFTYQKRPAILEYQKIVPTEAQPPAKTIKPTTKKDILGGVDPINQINQALTKAKKLSPQIVDEQHQERAKRVGMAAGSLRAGIEKGGKAEEAIFHSTGKLRGPLTDYEGRYKSIRDVVSAESIDAAFKSIADSETLKYFEIVNTSRAFRKLVDGAPLTLTEAGYIESHFGPDMGKVAMKRVPLGDRAWLTFVEALNIPRTMLASFDQSGILRQARPLGQAHPKEFAKMAVNYNKAFWSEKSANRLEKSYKADPYYEEAKQDKVLELPEWGKRSIEAVERAERFLGAGLVERSFVTALNWFRMSIYSKLRFAAEETGQRMTLAERKRLANNINDLSGRSHLKRTAAMKALTPLLNALFSPRFTISRFKGPATLFSGTARSIAQKRITPEAKQTAKAFASLIATNLLIMTRS
jgi:hypothetical protein